MPEIVVLSGAGLSAESGLGTFRDKDGLWTKFRLEDVATPEGFARDPAQVHAFYNARRANCAAATPNAAHHALARLKAARGDAVMLVTQNIDDLLERAGAEDVVHMHGRLMRARCGACAGHWNAPETTDTDTLCPHCGAAAARPDVVWFGEIPHHLDEISAALAECDLFVAIGTSGNVYPAAGFVAEASAFGARTMELSLDPTDTSDAFDETRLGPATKTVPQWVTEMIGP